MKGVSGISIWVFKHTVHEFINELCSDKNWELLAYNKHKILLCNALCLARLTKYK